MLARYRQKDTLPRLLPFTEGVYLHAFSCVHMCIWYMFVYLYTYTYIYIYVYIDIYKYIHTYTYIGVLLEYNNTSVESRNYQKKDGILVAIATIFKILNESKIHKVCIYVYKKIDTYIDR
jgi:hypothetical protein